MMKKDYAYILLLDQESSSFITKVQEYIVQKYVKASIQWPPHITLARGNFLTDEELEMVEEKLASLSTTTTCFKIVSDGFIFEKKGENNYALRIGIQKSDALHDLGKSIFEATKEFEAPIQTFTNEKYWITIVGGLSEVEKSEIEIYLKDIMLPEMTPSSFSVFYSVFNVDKPKEAYEIQRFHFCK